MSSKRRSERKQMKRLLALRCLFSVRTSKERERSLYLNRCPSLVKTPRVLIGRRMCLHASRCRSGSVYFLSHLPYPHHPLPGQSVFQRRTRVSSSALRAKPGAEPKPSPCECTPACRGNKQTYTEKYAVKRKIHQTTGMTVSVAKLFSHHDKALWEEHRVG